MASKPKPGCATFRRRGAHTKNRAIWLTLFLAESEGRVGAGSEGGT
jgi:hypothetical protein